jgi:hypothetical protein
MRVVEIASSQDDIARILAPGARGPPPPRPPRGKRGQASSRSPSADASPSRRDAALCPRSALRASAPAPSPHAGEPRGFSDAGSPPRLTSAAARAPLLPLRMSLALLCLLFFQPAPRFCRFACRWRSHVLGAAPREPASCRLTPPR